MSKKTKESPHVRQSGFRNARNSFTFGIQNYAQEIWNPVLKTGIPDPCSTAKESTEWNPGSKTYMGRKEEISIMDVQYQICRQARLLLVKAIFRQDSIKLPAWHSPPFPLIVSS